MDMSQMYMPQMYMLPVTNPVPSMDIVARGRVVCHYGRSATTSVYVARNC